MGGAFSRTGQFKENLKTVAKYVGELEECAQSRREHDPMRFLDTLKACWDAQAIIVAAREAPKQPNWMGGMF